MFFSFLLYVREEFIVTFSFTLQTWMYDVLFQRNEILLLWSGASLGEFSIDLLLAASPKVPP